MSGSGSTEYLYKKIILDPLPHTSAGWLAMQTPTLVVGRVWKALGMP